MTLRDIGQSIVSFWDTYLIQVTTQNVLDWSIGNLFLSIVFAVIGLMLLGMIIGAFTVVFQAVAAGWEKTGLPYTMERLDKRYGVYVSGLIMLVGTIVFLGLLGVFLALLEMAFA